MICIEGILALSVGDRVGGRVGDRVGDGVGDWGVTHVKLVKQAVKRMESEEALARLCLTLMLTLSSLTLCRS